MRLRIALYTFQYPNILGGVSTYCMNLAKQLTRNNHEVHIITPRNENIIKDRNLHETVNIRFPLIHYFPERLGAYEVIKAIKPDVVHAQHGGPGLVIKKCNVPQVLTVHSLSQTYISTYNWRTANGLVIRIGSPFMKHLEIENFKIANHLVFVYSQCRNDIQNQYRFNPVNYSCIPNGVDIEAFNPQKKRKEILDKYGKIIFFSGMNDERKGIPELMQIIKQYNQEYTEKGVSFIITGKGSLQEQLRTFSRKYHNVHVFGFVSEKILQELYASSFLFLFPTKMEAFPFSLLEALSSGCPILTTTVGGIPDLFSKEIEIGKMVNPKQKIPDYIKYIRYLVENEEVRNRLSLNSRKLVEEFFNWDRICDKIIKLYQSYIKDF
ncbi:MAG: glycosyltransferase family 4 protein [Candidatus Sigynarchaeota archaeon]